MNPLNYTISKARDIPYISGQYRLFAVVLDRKNRIVSEASNSYTSTHPKQFEAAKRVGKPEKVYCHAEALALIRSKGKGCKLVVARVKSDGAVANAKPCDVCNELIRQHGGIISVEYTIG